MTVSKEQDVEESIFSHLPDGLRHPVLEPNHIVFPITYMFTDFLTEDGGSGVVGIEVHVIRIDVARSSIVHNDCRACRSVCLPIAVWFDAFEPGRVRLNIVD